MHIDMYIPNLTIIILYSLILNVRLYINCIFRKKYNLSEDEVMKL
jgi:hypothetical protein